MTILCNPQDSTLLVVDTQTRLMPSIHEGENVVRRCVVLATAAHELGIHVIGTEENPEGLGPLVPEVAALCDTTLTKFHFSAPREEGFLRRLPAGRNTLVVAGCEAHVCVLQTVAGLLEAGPASRSPALAIASPRPTSSATTSSSCGSRSLASRCQACSRSASGAITLSIPASVTPRRMNGITVDGRSAPCASPHAATMPP